MDIRKPLKRLLRCGCANFAPLVNSSAALLFWCVSMTCLSVRKNGRCAAAFLTGGKPAAVRCSHSKRLTYLRWYQVTEFQLNHVLTAHQPLTVRDLCLNGYDLQFLGLSDAEIGLMQRWLLSIVLEDPSLNQVDTLRDLVIERMEEAHA